MIIRTCCNIDTIAGCRAIVLSLGGGGLILDNAFGRQFTEEAQAAQADDEFERKIV
jgi:hypothetical protein